MSDKLIDVARPAKRKDPPNPKKPPIKEPIKTDRRSSGKAPTHTLGTKRFRSCSRETFDVLWASNMKGFVTEHTERLAGHR